MRVLIINKFLYPNGGSETYIFKLGEALEQHGHEVQYFGMEHEGRCVGNRVNAYTSGMDFHGGSKLSKLTYPIKTIYSKEARVRLRKVLDDFKPDVCHLNNFNYQLTPSIILEIVKWRKETGRDCKIIFTAHDYQLVCPNHIVVFHKENGGLSTARNTGLDHAAGEYIAFVDSDDWLEPNMYQDLITQIEEHNADMAVSSFYECKENEKNAIGDSKNVKVLNTEEIFSNKNQLRFLVWNKIFRKAFVENLRFVPGQVYEDFHFCRQAYGSLLPCCCG